jgi:hypothetical protein
VRWNFHVGRGGEIKAGGAASGGLGQANAGVETFNL